MAQVAVSVAVAGGGRSDVDESVEDVGGLPAQEQRAVQRAQSGGIKSQNDIADFLQIIIGLLGADSGLGKLLQRIADFFEGLDPDGTKPWALEAAVLMALDEFASKPQAQALPDWLNAECFQTLLANAKADVTEAGLMLAQKAPQRLQEFLTCLLANDTQAQKALAGFNIDVTKLVGCLIPAAMLYFQTKNIGSAIGSFFSCMMSGGGGGNGGGGGAQVEHETVQRC